MGEIVAIPLRGAWTEIVRSHASDLWITCALEFRDRWREQWLPNRFTWLYFHDEAVSFAAGHRPCAECRWRRYQDYRAAWAEGLGVAPPTAKEMNRRLHAERIFRGSHRRRLHELPWRELPDGAFVRHDEVSALVLGDALVEWGETGYGRRQRRPRQGKACVITPPATVAAVRAGYPVQIDAGAG
jgi:hypothetical protein